eukprot:TRINITY_DN5080_c0_g1_i2.p1 TRINITY_DN5080_c0_g1~~TRINITY_DN5080_c0_g1_i2.p1  ORF type:complete len:679 (+),score=159.43 TRINITY_DN5080_c0_g1_i2:126-2162(+)
MSQVCGAMGVVRDHLCGHAGWVGCVAYAPSGAVLASGGDDRTVRLWDPTTGKCKAVLQGHGGYVMDVAYAPDGRALASASDDRVVRVWNPATGACTATLAGHGGCVNAVAYSPDGKLLATASDDRTVRLWRTATNEAIGCLRGHANFALAVAFSPDGATLASGGADGCVKLWDTAAMRCTATLQDGGRDAVHTVAFAPGGRVLAAGGRDGAVALWSVPSGDRLRTLVGHAAVVVRVAFSPDGVWLMSSSKDKSVREWHVADGAAGNVYADAHGRHLATGLAYAPDGASFASSGYDRCVKVWREGGAPVKEIAAPAEAVRMDVVPAPSASPRGPASDASSDDAVPVTPASADGTPSFRCPAAGRAGRRAQSDPVQLKWHAAKLQHQSIIDDVSREVQTLSESRRTTQPLPMPARPVWASEATPPVAPLELNELRPSSTGSLLGKLPAPPATARAPYGLPPVREPASVESRPLSAPVVVPHAPLSPPRGGSPRPSASVGSDSESASSIGDGSSCAASETSSVMSGSAAFATRATRPAMNAGGGIGSIPTVDAEAEAYRAAVVDARRTREAAMRQRANLHRLSCAVAVSHPTPEEHLAPSPEYLYRSRTSTPEVDGDGAPYSVSTAPRRTIADMDRRQREVLRRKKSSLPALDVRGGAVAGESSAETPKYMYATPTGRSLP